MPRFRRGWWFKTMYFAFLQQMQNEAKEEKQVATYMPLPYTFLQYFGFRGSGGMRWTRAAQVGDPERALFGLGPCGELAYQMYKQAKKSYKPSL